MTDQQLKISIEKERLKLNNWGTFTHYSIVVFCFFIPSLFGFMYTKDYLIGEPKPFNPELLWFIIVPSVLGITFYLIQKKKLKLKSVETNLGKKKILKIVEEIAQELNWSPWIVTRKVIISKSNPSFFSGSWGEQITVIFDKNRVLVNSICDPDKRSSLVSMGRNKKNIAKLIHEIKRASS